MPERGILPFILGTGALSFFGVWVGLMINWRSSHDTWNWWPAEELWYFAAFSALCAVALAVFLRARHEKSTEEKPPMPPPSGGSLNLPRETAKRSKAMPKVIGDVPVSEIANSPARERGREAVEEVLQRKIYYPLDSNGNERKPIGVLFLEEQERLKGEHEQWARDHPAVPPAPPRTTASQHIRDEARRESERAAFEEVRMQEAIKAGKASYAAEHRSRTRRIEDAATGGYATHEIGSREMVAFDSAGNSVGTIQELRGGGYAITFITGKTSMMTFGTAVTAIEALVRESWR